MNGNTYKVTITEVLSKTVIVRANSEAEAYDCVYNHYNHLGDIVLTAEDFCESSVSEALPVEMDDDMVVDFDATEEEK